MREIDYDKLLANVSEMINTLEHDSMRSGGKAKLNAPTLVDLYELKKHYQTIINSKKQPAKKEA
jgi:hypothetical protein